MASIKDLGRCQSRGFCNVSENSRHAKSIFVDNQQVIPQGFCTLPQWIKSSIEGEGDHPRLEKMSRVANFLERELQKIRVRHEVPPDAWNMWPYPAMPGCGPVLPCASSLLHAVILSKFLPLKGDASRSAPRSGKCPRPPVSAVA